MYVNVRVMCVCMNMHIISMYVCVSMFVHQYWSVCACTMSLYEESVGICVCTVPLSVLSCLWLCVCLCFCRFISLFL